MNPNPIKPLIIFLIALAGLLYAFSIGYAGYQSLRSESTMEPLLASAVTVIGAILSTNLGAVLGVTLTPPTTKPEIIQPKFLGLKPSFNSAFKPTENKIDSSQKLQVLACWVYVGSLVIALIFWVIAKINGIADEELIPLLPELVKTLFGVMVGAITVALGKS